MAAALVVVLVVLLEMFSRTPGAVLPQPPPAPPSPVAAAINPNNPDPGPAPPSEPVKDKPPAPKDRGLGDSPPAVTAVYDDATTQATLRDWLKTVPADAPKDILLSGDVDLTRPKDGGEIGLALAGPSVTIRAKTPGRRPTIRFTYDTQPQEKDASWAALRIESPSVTVRGVRILVDGTAADVNMIGLRLQGPRGASSTFTVDNCEFIQTQPGRKGRLASLEAVATGAPADLKLTTCRFLSFQKREGDTTLLSDQFVGNDAVVRDGAVRITATECAFGPHGADFRLQGGDSGTTLALDHCSVLASGSAAVLDVQLNAAVDLKLHACLFSCPDGAADAPADRPALIRQATPDDGVACQDSDSRYAGFDAYWVVGGDYAQSGWRSFLARVPTAKPPLPAGASPWQNDDPLSFFRTYNIADAQAETHFVRAFQVMETRPELRVAAVGDKSAVPVGVQTLGGVSYTALLAAADRQAAGVAQSQAPHRRSRPERQRQPHLRDTAGSPVGVRARRRDPPPLRRPAAGVSDPARQGEPPGRDHPAGAWPASRAAAEGRRGSRSRAGPVPRLRRQIDAGRAGAPAATRRQEFRPPVAGRSGWAGAVRLQKLSDYSGYPVCTDTRLAVALLSDPGKAMMPSTRPADQPAQLSFDNCFVRGEGDLVACQTSRALDLKAANTLATLKGALLNVEVAPEAPAAPAGQMALALDRVTTCLAGNLIRLRSGKDARSLEPVHCARTIACSWRRPATRCPP